MRKPLPLLRVMVWEVRNTENIGANELETLIGRLPLWRREKALRYKNVEGQVACACSYLLLQHILKEKFDIVESPGFSYNEAGKPSLINFPEIFFSMSHCRGAVACAVSREPVGIDIENLRQPKPDVLEYVCNVEEIADVIDSIDPAVKFTELWTRKEAYAKLTGEGITHRVRDLLTDSNSVIETFRVDGRVVSIAHYK